MTIRKLKGNAITDASITEVQLSANVNGRINSISGNINFVSKFTSGTAVGNSSLYNDATGNVGIGTTTPNGNLHITGTILDTPVTSITSSATYAENAAGKVIFANSSSAVTVTFANATTSGFSITVVRGNTGNVTIANSGPTRLNVATYATMNVAQYGGATVLYTATNQIIVFGDFG